MLDLKKLVQLIAVEKINENKFKGENSFIGSPNVFGGQVIAQSLYAAYQTVSNDRQAHSLHSYFLLPGKLNEPIIYEVENVRDGSSFSTRRVLAKQNDKTIFIISISFQISEYGYEHQSDIKPDVKLPEFLLSWDDIYKTFKDQLPISLKKYLEIDRPVEFRPVQIQDFHNPKNEKASRQVWFRLKENDPHLSISNQHQILSYISDYNLLTTALAPHASEANFENTYLASIDHAMWFHRDFDLTQWHLYCIESPFASNARGFTTGKIFSMEGKLIASVTQEGLMRPMLKN